MSSWLDSESNYRLTVEQVKEAKKGASYASNEYEKWETVRAPAACRRRACARPMRPGAPPEAARSGSTCAMYSLKCW